MIENLERQSESKERHIYTRTSEHPVITEYSRVKSVSQAAG